MDAVSIWKAVSVGVTGAFGVLGLLTEFKDEDTKRLTRWGKVSLTGILASTVAGVGFQIKDSSDAADAQAKTSAQTLAIAQATQKTVGDVSRLLTPLTKPQVSVVLQVSCGVGRYAQYCANLKAIDSKIKWTHGRRAIASLRPERELIALQLCFYKLNPTAKQVKDSGYAYAGDLSYTLLGINDEIYQNLVMHLSQDKNKLEIYVYGRDEMRPVSNGTLSSTLDFPGSTLILYEPNGDLDALVPVSINLGYEGGREVNVQLRGMRRITVGGKAAYQISM